MAEWSQPERRPQAELVGEDEPDEQQGAEGAPVAPHEPAMAYRTRPADDDVAPPPQD